MELLYFYKDDCLPCAERKPKAIEAAERADVLLTFVNSEDAAHLPLVEQHRIRSVPTLVLVDDEGRRRAGWSGGMINTTSVLRFLGKA